MKIRQLRTNTLINGKPMSLDDLSKLSGVSKSRLSDLENGIGSPSVATLTKIAKAFKVSIEELL